MAELELPGSLVSAEWLQEHIQDDKVLVLDASWHLPAKDRCGRDEWETVRIPGAVFFDYDGDIKDQETSLPRMLPDADLFTEEVRKLGVDSDSLVVVYDANSMFSSPRAWWMFRAMGHERVAVLDGGLRAWQDADHALETEKTIAAAYGNFTAEKNDRFINADYVRRHLCNDKTVILDARSDERYAAGRMPGAKSLPYMDLLEDGKMKSIDDLKYIFASKIGAQKKLLCSCGSGVTACVLALGAELAGFTDVVVYDASWTEWGAEGGDFPIDEK